MAFEPRKDRNPKGNAPKDQKKPVPAPNTTAPVAQAPSAPVPAPIPPAPKP